MYPHCPINGNTVSELEAYERYLDVVEVTTFYRTDVDEWACGPRPINQDDLDEWYRENLREGPWLFFCSEFPEQTYDSYRSAERATLEAHGMSFINGDRGYITARPHDIIFTFVPGEYSIEVTSDAGTRVMSMMDVSDPISAWLAYRNIAFNADAYGVSVFASGVPQVEGNEGEDSAA